MASETDNKQDAEAKQKMESKPIVESKTEVNSGKRSGKRWILIGFLVLVVMIAGFGFWAYPHFLGSKKSEASSKVGAQIPKEDQVKATLALEPFLVNLADADEIRFVKTTFQLGLAEEQHGEGKDMVAIAAMRDAIITLLSSKTAEQILTPQGKEKLREEVRHQVNTVSPSMKVVEVYIVDFVVQL